MELENIPTLKNIPEKYLKDLKNTRQLLNDISKTHIGVEEMSIFNVLCDIGNLTILDLGVRGTGKSRVSELIKKMSKRQVLPIHGVTGAGLRHYEQILSNTSTTIICEDLSRAGKEYMQTQTVSTLAGLSYTHFITKHSHSVNVEISGCICSVLIFSQPLIMKSLVSQNEYETDIQDKCLRFYQLKRPIIPNIHIIESNIQYLTLDRNKNKKIEEIIDDTILEQLNKEVSIGRAKEYCITLLNANASFNDRTKINDADIWLLQRLTRNFKIEDYLFTKHHLEGLRSTDPDVVPLITCLMTYPKNTVKSIAMEYQLSESRTRQILNELGFWVFIQNGEVLPTPQCKEVIEEISS